jgi:hypothetical protein
MPTPPRLDLSAQQVKAIPLHRDWPEPSQFRERDVSPLLGAIRYSRARLPLASFNPLQSRQALRGLALIILILPRRWRNRPLS